MEYRISTSRRSGDFEVSLNDTTSVQVCSDSDAIRRRLRKNFRQWVGRCDIEDMESNSIIYAEDESALPDLISSPVTFGQAAFQEVRQRIFVLWLIRDCAVDAKQFFLEVNVGLPVIPIYKTWGSMILSNCHGRKEPTSFTQQEILSIFETYRKKVVPLTD